MNSPAHMTKKKMRLDTKRCKVAVRVSQETLRMIVNAPNPENEARANLTAASRHAAGRENPNRAVRSDRNHRQRKARGHTSDALPAASREVAARKVAPGAKIELRDAFPNDHGRRPRKSPRRKNPRRKNPGCHNLSSRMRLSCTR